MGIAQRDPAEVATLLEAWMLTRPGVDRVRVRDVHTPPGTGWSNETILFDVDIERGGSTQSQALVARVAPSGYRVFPDDTSTETAAYWSARTGRSTDALDYYVLFAGLRFTVIMLRMGKLLCDMGLVPDTFAYDNLISTATAELLEEAS